jgi:hypothetical protein
MLNQLGDTPIGAGFLYFFRVIVIIDKKVFARKARKINIIIINSSK